MAIAWDPSLSVGVRLIDEQHQELFRRVDALVDAMRRGDAKPQLARMLGFLGEYVVQHFGAEERLMEQYHYPSTARHKRQHAEFVKTFTEVKDEHEALGPTSRVTVALNQFVVAWLREHIGGSDLELGRFLQHAGGRETVR